MPTFKKPIKKVFKKKTVRKTSAINAIATVSMHHNKLLGALFDSVYYECRNSREFEDSATPGANTPGLMPFIYNTAYISGSHKVLPFHIYDMTSLTQNGTGTAFLGSWLFLDNITNVSSFGTMSPSTSINLIGSSDGGSYQTLYNKTMMEYYNFKIDLFQRDKYATEYTIQLLKINDETLQPSGSGNLHNNFWKMLSRPSYTNTLMPNDPRVKEDYKGRYNILWEKTYKLPERLNDSDSYKSKRVNLFKRVNKVLKYNELPTINVVTADDPNTVQISPSAGNNTNTTRVKDRIYIIIKANNTIDQNRSATGFDGISTAPASVDIPSYNFYWKSKHTIPQS